MLNLKQSGITLIEMMIAMVLGLIVTGTIITIFISNVKSTTETVKMTRLNQELRTVMNFMADELKRAGYSADPDADFFMDSYVVDVTSGAECVLYAYDVNANGTSEANESFGFRLDINQIKWQSGVTACGDISQALTDPDTARITDFTLTPTALAADASSAIQTHNLEISITGETDLNPNTASREVRETIRVRNDAER